MNEKVKRDLEDAAHKWAARMDRAKYYEAERRRRLEREERTLRALILAGAFAFLASLVSLLTLAVNR